jgi:hydroxylaminobenzene mutase
MNQPDIWTKAQHRLVSAGIWLFLLGLLTGFVIPLMENPRVGLSSHLEGVINGIFLLALAAVWRQIGLVGFRHHAALWLAIFAAIANWLATFLAAIWGTGAMMPIAAPGRTGAAVHETVVSLLLMSLSLAMVAACIAILSGLIASRRGTANQARSATARKAPGDGNGDMASGRIGP